jgi:DNA-binding NtrC family response regulator
MGNELEQKELENLITTRVRPIVEQAMHKFLGVTVSEIESDISDKLKRPLMDFDINSSLSFKQAKRLFKKQYLARLLQLKFGNVAEVARLSGIDRRSVHRLIAEFKLDPGKLRDAMPIDYFKQTAVKNIVESALETYKSALNPKKFTKFYQQAPEISKDIIKQLPTISMTLKDAERMFEKRFIEQALIGNDWNVSKTARKIGLRFETLHRKIKGLGLTDKK